MAQQQLTFPFGPVRNSELFSSHWLEHRLALEPEWNELRGEAENVLDRLKHLWLEQRELVSQYGDEQGLEQAFIQPVLGILGWELKYQTFLRGRKPDYALFHDKESLRNAVRAGRDNPDFWKYATVVADAKAWQVSLDRPVRVKNQREYPPEQIEWYLNASELGYGILTNGKLWRLVPRKHTPDQPRFATYLECDLETLLDLWAGFTQAPQRTIDLHKQIVDEFLRFYLFFRPQAFLSIPDRPSLVSRATEGSSEYRLGVGEGLRDRVFEALRLSIQGFLAYEPNQLRPDTHLSLCREQSFILLYRLLFIMYAEDRQLLPYRVNNLYTENRSLARHRDEIATTLDRLQLGRGTDFARDGTELWEDLKSLFDLVDSGNRRYGVPAYNGGLFDGDGHPFLEEKALPDWHLARVIDQLGRAPDSEHPDAGLFRVDYRDLAIQHLGSVYEGLLEMQPHYATEAMVVVQSRSRERTEQRVLPMHEDLPDGFERTSTRFEPGDVYLLTHKGERRATGSYYTPNHIVDYIVERTLRPLCRQIDEGLSKQIEAAQEHRADARGQKRTALDEVIERLEGEFDDRVLALRVLDPAMGSGHFLLRACQYLAEEVATNPHTSDPQGEQLSGDESVLTFWKRRIVERCLYGVDLNPMAVELAKLALWLETAAIDQPLTFLDHHLRYGNSLVGAKMEALGVLPDTDPLQRSAFENVMRQRLPVLLKAFEEIAAIPSDQAARVKEKERLYRRAVANVIRPFRELADIWCASFFLPPEAQPTPDQYNEAVKCLLTSRRFEQIRAEDWFRKGTKAGQGAEVACFHWELEFPEVFFDGRARELGGGFDAIIGNPPYDVLSDKETGRDFSSLRSFLKAEAAYEPTFLGKNNLYKLFVCRALDLLRHGGRVGFITPMALLGDLTALGLRKAILQCGAFASIDAFPQKDDPTHRVFREAKLSTVAFTAVRGGDASIREAEFASSVHPGNAVELSSPRLILRACDIPLYDPENLTIVSCSQMDWDLATRIMRTDRLTRLKEHVEFFQGEVNETNERKKGTIVSPRDGGRLVTRGACICLYIPRPASQGDDLFLDVRAFLDGKEPGTKAFHHRCARVCVQESSPQNNFRRIIASRVQAGEFCNHTVNYCPENSMRMPIEMLLGLLNSKLADWYFRLGSTNAHVSHYQLYNLPYPVFRSGVTEPETEIHDRCLELLASGKCAEVFAIIKPLVESAPFSLAARDMIVEAVRRIIVIEENRGEIARTERSALAAAAQPYQDLIDRLLYAMAGLTEDEIRGLEERLARML